MRPNRPNTVTLVAVASAYIFEQDKVQKPSEFKTSYSLLTCLSNITSYHMISSLFHTSTNWVCLIGYWTLFSVSWDFRLYLKLTN